MNNAALRYYYWQNAQCCITKTKERKEELKDECKTVLFRKFFTEENICTRNSDFSETLASETLASPQNM